VRTHDDDNEQEFVIFLICCRLLYRCPVFTMCNSTNQ
jgi:hypothetical protein